VNSESHVHGDGSLTDTAEGGPTRRTEKPTRQSDILRF